MSTLKAINVQHPSSATINLVNDSSGNVTVGNNLTVTGTSTLTGNVTAAGTVAMASSFKRNRIINGNMLIDQRNAGASVTIPDSTITYGVDRFLAYESTSASSCTVQQVSDAPNSTTNGVVFTNSLKFTVGTGGTATAAQLAILEQRIEGYNVADFGYGASGALTTTLRFWVKSSVTGTFCVGLRNAGDTRSYVSTYTISAANTWEQKTITIAGDTTGTWNTTNGSGIQIRWDLGSGSTYQTSTLNAWQAGLYFSTSGQANVIGTSGATFYITGVQLEVGTKATPYEMQIYSDQLAQCQRYYKKYTNEPIGFTRDGYVPYNAISLKVTMRSTPTLDAGGAYSVNTGAAGTVALAGVSGLGALQTPDGFMFGNSSGNWTAGACVLVTAGLSAEL